MKPMLCRLLIFISSIITLISHGSTGEEAAMKLVKVMLTLAALYLILMDFGYVSTRAAKLIV